MLRLVEEIMLLLLRDQDGRFVGVPTWSLDYAIAGGVLMDLAMENRIDTDLENLILLDSTPVGDSLLDPTLAAIAAGGSHDTRFWVEHIAERADETHEEALSRLVSRGILERQDDRFLWVFRSRRYPGDRRQGGAGSEAADHGSAVQRRDPGPARCDGHLPSRCVRHLQ